MKFPEEALQAATVALWGTDTSNAQDAARRALEAAARSLMEQAWDEGHKVGASEYWDDNTLSNPYRVAAR